MQEAKKFMMALMLLSVGCSFGQAQSSSQSSQSSVDWQILRRTGTPRKHKAPSNVFIEYTYTGSGFYFLSTDFFESLDVTVTNVGSTETWSSILSEEDGYALETGPLSAGIYTISAVTEGGVEFHGQFELLD